MPFPEAPLERQEGRRRHAARRGAQEFAGVGIEPVHQREPSRHETCSDEKCDGASANVPMGHDDHLDLGRATVKVVPSASGADTLRLPPWARTIWSATKRATRMPMETGS